VVFAFVKATQGTGFNDPTFKSNWNSLDATNVYRGAYHFLTSDTDPVEQAKFFVAAVKAAGGVRPADMPPSLDVEWDIHISGGKVVLGPDGKPRDFWQDVEPDVIVAKMDAWLSYVEQQLGRTPMIYTSRAWWLGRIKNESAIKKFAKYKTWIADYSKSGLATENPPDFKDHPKSLWQFSDGGKVTGIANGGGNLGVDVSIFKGTKNDLKKEFGIP